MITDIHTDLPRTSAHIIRDLLEHVKEHEWVQEYDFRRNAWETKCSSCNNYYQSHKKDCHLVALILEADTFLDIEHELSGEVW